MTRDEAKATLKPGDRVRVVRKVDQCREIWVGPAMDNSIGATLRVDRLVSAKGGVHLSNGWWYPPEALEPELYGNEEED